LATDGADLFSPSAKDGKAIDAASALPMTPFYSSEGIKPGPPGKLVRSEPAKDYDLPPGVTATRILYHSRTADGRDALASGMVLVPYGKPPPGGWPLLAWSHGTSGVDKQCAPSRMKRLFYNWEGLYEYPLMGYAVVATDYVGLGTDGKHAYIDMTSNGTDVINSVPAAHAAVPNLSDKWIAIGHSQGGLSVMGVAELEGKIRDPNFLGTVALAGASDLQDGIESVVQAKQPVLNGLLAFTVYGAKSVYPDLDLHQVFTDKALAAYNKSVTDGCSAAAGAFSEVPADEMFKTSWRDSKPLQKFFARNQPGMKPTYGPMLIVTGGTDPLFTEKASQKVAERLCKAGQSVQRNVYPGLAHDPLVYGSLPDQLKWIAARFEGEPAPSNCNQVSQAG
jgi:pimeloyl-ACP methyl ester carboxylesterase